MCFTSSASVIDCDVVTRLQCTEGLLLVRDADITFANVQETMNTLHYRKKLKLEAAGLCLRNRSSLGLLGSKLFQ